MAAGRAISGLLVLAMVAAMGIMGMAQLEDEEDVSSLGVYQPRDPCPQVESIVQRAVGEEFARNPQITAGFLRVFFHDCFSGGCDASILLDGEWDGGVNRGSVQPAVRALVNRIRALVNRECGDRAVSCADILTLATRDAVAAAKGPRVPVSRGRFDSLQPGDFTRLPGPGQPIDDLLTLFGEFGLKDPADLVALSGGHTVGKTKLCFLVRPGFQRTCASNGNRQNLDVITPDEFDNKFFEAVTKSQGVFDSDQNLLNNTRTQRFVLDFARDKQTFFRQWAVSFKRLSDINWVRPNTGEIRRDCTKPNRARIVQQLLHDGHDAQDQ